jgi:hypothetical protein
MNPVLKEEYLIGNNLKKLKNDKEMVFIDNHQFEDLDRQVIPIALLI